MRNKPLFVILIILLIGGSGWSVNKYINIKEAESGAPETVATVKAGMEPGALEVYYAKVEEDKFELYLIWIADETARDCFWNAYVEFEDEYGFYLNEGHTNSFWSDSHEEYSVILSFDGFENKSHGNIVSIKGAGIWQKTSAGDKKLNATEITSDQFVSLNLEKEGSESIIIVKKS